MLKKSIVIGMFFLIFAAFRVNAANVSFLVMETGIRHGSPSNRYSTMWENGLLEFFFESGHIVSNAPMMRLSEKLAEKPEEKLPPEAERDYENAKQGGMDFFIIAIVNYPVSGGNNLKPENVILRLFNTKSGQIISEQVFSDTKAKGAKEENDFIKNAVSQFAANLNRRQ